MTAPKPMLIVTVALSGDEHEYAEHLMMTLERKIAADSKVAVIGCELALLPDLSSDP